MKRLRDFASMLITPGGIAEGRVLPICWSLLSLLATTDYLLGQTVRLHTLYVFPVALIAIHCEKGRLAYFSIAGASVLQAAVLNSYAQPLLGTAISWIVATLVLALVAELSRNARRLYISVSHLATHDPLAHLYNRRAFEVRLQNEIERKVRYGGSFALVSIDLDRFKELNDTRGHDAGDQALLIIANVLHSQSRTSDTAARMGGDEFMMLLLNTNQTICAEYCDKLLTRIEEEMRVAGFSITASIGCQVFESSTTMQSALVAVDLALYRAKSSGRNRVVVSETTD